MRKIFSRNKKTHTDLNFKAFDLNFLFVVNSFMAYNLWKLQIDSLKIEAWATLCSLISEPLKIGFFHDATAKSLFFLNH